MVSARDTWLIQLRARRAAAKVITLFAEHGIDVLPVKGIVTAHTLYADVAERILTDVDLKIRPEDFRSALRVVRSTGLPLLQLLRAYGNFVVSVDGVAVDVESHPSAPGLCSLRVATMIERATPSDLFGVPHLLPDPYDHAVVLVLNVFKDKLGHAFRWAVRDVEILGERLAAPPLIARLTEASALTMGYIVATWMAERGHSSWRGLAEAMLSHRPRLAYARAHATLLRGTPHDTMKMRLHSRLGSDSPLLRVSAIVRAAAGAIEMRLSQLGATPYRRGGVPNEFLPD